VGGIAVDETGVWAIVGANREGTAVRIDPDTNCVIDSVPVPNPSFWNDIDAGAGGIWVTTSPIVRQDDVPLVELYRINPVTRTVEATVGVGRGTTGLGEGGGSLSRPRQPAAIRSGSTTTSNGSSAVWTWQPNVVVETLPVGSCCSAGLPPGMAVGYGALWVTGDDDLMRVTLFGA
jgi:hypothetical protein